MPLNQPPVVAALPDLDADTHAIWNVVTLASERQSAGTPWLAVMAAECDRLTEAVTSIADVLTLAWDTGIDQRTAANGEEFPGRRTHDSGWTGRSPVGAAP